MNLTVDAIKDLILARIYEYGVKGQLWGVRRGQGSSIGAALQRTNRSLAKIGSGIAPSSGSVKKDWQRLRTLQKRHSKLTAKLLRPRY